MTYNATLGGSATAGDFTARSGVLTFNQGDTFQTFTIQVAPDAIVAPVITDVPTTVSKAST